MPQNLAGLTQLGQGYAPFAPGIAPTQRTPLDGLPLVGASPLASLAAMAATPYVQRAMGQVGMVPLGLGHDQNAFDALQSLRFQQMQEQAVRMVAESDRAGVEQLVRGGFALAGTPFGPEQQRFARTVSGGFAAAAPVLAALAPDLVDRLAGQRGSAAVMAHHLVAASRYRLDPLTGQLGFDAESNVAQARRVFRDLYETPGGAAGLQGLRAGQAGELLAALQARGLVRGAGAEVAEAPGLRADDPRGQVLRALREMDLTDPAGVRAAAKRQGVALGPDLKVNAQDLDKLKLDPQIADRVRAFDADRVRRSIEDYADAIAAMRDIFGDAGHPDAPVPQLIASLEALTMGQMGRMAPQRLGQLVRQTYNLAKQGGIPLEQALVLQQHVAARAQALGIEPVFALKATQDALAFGTAYRASGQGANPVWGGLSADQTMQLDANLRTQAAASPAANRINAVMRLASTAGGFAAGSEAANYAEAVRQGFATYRDAQGRSRSVVLGQADALRLLTEARDTKGNALGLDTNAALGLLAQTDANREQGDLFHTDALVRRGQGDEVRRFVGASFQNTFAARLAALLRDRGDPAAQDKARRAAAAVSQRVARRAFAELSDDERTNPALRVRRTGELIEEELKAAGQGDLLAGMGGDEKRQFLGVTADLAFGQADQAIKRSRYGAFGTVVNAMRLNDGQTLDAGDRRAMDAALRGRLQAAAAPLRDNSLLSRAVDALRAVKPGDPQAARRLIARALGGVDARALDQALVGQMQVTAEKWRAVEAAQGKVADAGDPRARAAAATQRDAAERTLREEIARLAALHPKLPEAVRQVDPNVSKEDLQNALARGGAGSQVEAEAVLTARRMEQVDRLAAGGGDAQDQRALERALKEADRRHPGMDPAARRQAALDILRGEAGGFDPKDRRTAGELAALRRDLRPRTEGEAMALILTRRRLRAAGEDLAALRQLPGAAAAPEAGPAAAGAAGAVPAEEGRGFWGTAWDTLRESVLAATLLPGPIAPLLAATAPEVRRRRTPGPFAAGEQAPAGAVAGEVAQAAALRDPAATPAGGGPDGPLPIQGHLTGEFRIVGDRVDMVADAGGGRQFVP